MNQKQLQVIELENMSQEELEKNIRNYSVYARVSPEHKVRIVKAWQKNGEAKKWRNSCHDWRWSK